MALSIKTIVGMFAVGIVLSLSPILLSRRWDWWEGWTYALVSLLGMFVSRGVVACKNPDLLEERANWKRHKNTKAYDKVFAPILGYGSIVLPLLAGLDERQSWSSFSWLQTTPEKEQSFLFLKYLSFAAIVLGYVIGSYALVENRFFSGVVRIQTDRGHYVVSTGPYAWVRHPGYSGILLVYMGTPLWLDSPLCFLPVAFLTMVIILRTSLEDRDLRAELKGYKIYTERVKFRLVPGLW